MILTEGDHMIHQLATATAYPPFGHTILPGAPHVGFSQGMRRISLQASTSGHGRPNSRDFLRQYQRNPLLCQCTTVAGLMMTSALLHFGHNFRSNNQNPRSTHLSCDLGPFSLRTANCCRRARFSMARAVLDRKIDPTERKSAVAML